MGIVSYRSLSKNRRRALILQTLRPLIAGRAMDEKELIAHLWGRAVHVSGWLGRTHLRRDLNALRKLGTVQRLAHASAPLWYRKT